MSTAAPSSDRRHVIFLSGAIGTGKTTLGRALARALRGGFIDGDDHADPDKPWYATIKTTSARILRAALALLSEQPVVVIAYPLRRRDWIYYRRKFADAGVRPLFITLRAPLDTIIHPGRGRIFSSEESARIAIMIDEGYSRRDFSDAFVDTGTDDFPTAFAQLETTTRALMKSGTGQGDGT